MPSTRGALRSPAALRFAFVANVSAIAVLAGSVHGHDEDWRKLADVLGPVAGPIYRAADAPDPLTASAAGGETFDADGVELLAQIPINNFDGFHGSANDLWGYTSPAGREYAILGLERGFGFVDVTAPNDPVIIETISGPASLWHDVKVIGAYAYGVSEGGAGVQVMDLSRIDDGIVELVRNSTAGGHTTTHNIVSNEEAGTLYLAGANIGNGGLIRLGLSDPERPSIVGGWTQMYVHDAQVVTWDSGPLAGREIAFCASGFDGGFTQTGLRIVDMTDPTSPEVLATLFYPNAGYSHQVWLSEDQSTLYLNDELDEQGGQVSVTTTRVIDVSDPTQPQLLGTFTSGKPAIDHNLYTHDGLIYQANYRSGLRIFDAADPRDPVEIAFFDTFPGSDSASFNGAWSVYPFFESGTVTVSDIERGLFVLRVTANPNRLLFDASAEFPSIIDADGGDVLEISISERGSATLDASSVRMLLSDAAGQQTIEGTPNGDGGFAFTLPPVSCGGDVAFSFEAETTEGEAFAFTQNGAGGAFTARPTTDVDLAFADDFESDAGWSVSGNAADGQWTRGVPVNAGRSDPPADADGSGRAFVTDNDASNGGNSDVDDGFTRLTSPPFDTSGGALVTYAYWYDIFGTDGTGDSLLVEVSTDGGETWSIAAEHTTPDAEWRDVAFFIEAGDGSADTRIRFTASDVDPQSVVEAGVDAFRVDRIACETAQPCAPADVAPPFGTLDQADIEAFAAGPEDFNGDGSTDVFDLLALLDGIAAGCP